LRVKAERIKVLGNAPSLQRYAYEDNILSQLHVQSNEYFLMIGSSSVRKNTQVIAQLFAMDHMLADYKLVIVGGEYANLSAATSIQAENIVYTGYIGDGELRSLYRNAVALIFPSLYEGFGIPVIEAIAEHCLVIVSDIPVMREICGEHAIYFNPHNAEDLKKKLCVLLANPDLLYSNTKLANKQLIRYNWLKFAKILLWDLLEHGR
jgi:glycosyltransferase involved in cell wall biosynthesis